MNRFLQEALVKRLGPNAHAFTMEITPLAPPSVQLVPAKEYNGAPIGTSYDVRAYVGEWKKPQLFSFRLYLDFLSDECISIGSMGNNSEYRHVARKS